MSFKKSIVFSIICNLIFQSGIAQKPELSKLFYFGNHTNRTSGVPINSSLIYQDEIGYGFDFFSGKNVKIEENSIYSYTPFYFSVKLPEGNYRVDVILGGKKSSVTSIKAESKRLMLREQKTNKNDTVHCSFAVNVRTPRINGQDKINIKDREINYLNWDNKLTLEFSGTPLVQSIKITPISSIRTIFLAGDSTVTDQDLEPWASWGQLITQYFNESIVVANYANSGASLSSFKARHRLEKILSLMQPGDYVFIEFGHNDEKIKEEENGAWGLYTHLLKEFVIQSREKGGIPVLVTPTQRRAFNDDGTLKPTHGDFPDAMRKVANDLHVPLIDLTKMTTKMYESWGDDVSRKAFVQYPANTFPGQTETLEDNTHFNSFGANEIAKCIVQGIKDLNLGISLYLKSDIPDYNPKNPDHLSDWTVPMSTRFDNNKPFGN